MRNRGARKLKFVHGGIIEIVVYTISMGGMLRVWACLQGCWRALCLQGSAPQAYIEVCGAHTFFTSERKRGIYKERAREREKEGGRDREKERESEIFLFLKGMTGALAPFSYLVILIWFNLQAYTLGLRQS